MLVIGTLFVALHEQKKQKEATADDWEKDRAQSKDLVKDSERSLLSASRSDMAESDDQPSCDEFWPVSIIIVSVFVVIVDYVSFVY